MADQTYTDTLVYRVKIDNDDLDAIQASVATSTAAGVRQGSGVNPTAPAPGGTTRGGFGSTATPAGGATSAATFARAVQAFTSAVGLFTSAKGGGAPGSASGGPGTGKPGQPPPLPSGPPPLPGGKQNYFSALFNKSGVTPLGQMLGMHRGGRLAQYVRSLGMQPGGGWLGRMTGTALQAGGGMGGVGGRAMMGLAGGIMGGMAGGMGGAVAGVAAGAVGGPAGVAVAAAVSAIKMFASVMDGLVEKFGKYSAGTSEASAKLKVTSILFDVKMSKLLEPIMAWWVNLKSKVLDIFADVMERVINVVKGVWNVFVGFLKMTGVLTVLQAAVKAVIMWFEMLWKSTKFLAESLLQIAKWIVDKMSWAIPGAAEMSKGIQQLIDSMKEGGKSLSEAMKDMVRDWMRFGAQGAQGVQQGRGGSMVAGARRDFFNTRLTSSQLTRRLSGEGLAAAMDRRHRMFERDSVNDPGYSNAQLAKRGGPWAYLRQKDFSRTFMQRTNVHKGGESGMKVAIPPPPAPMPQVDWDTIKQKVEFNLHTKLAHEEAVQAMIMQIRGKLLEGLTESRDETRLLAGMLDAGLSGGF